MTTIQEISADSRYRRCLDHGFCGLVDYMGNDDDVAIAARTSYAKGTKQVRDNRGLIRYLLRHAHTSPFEMCVAKFHMRLPIFVARQFVRHRTASINEVSGRYSVLDTEFYIPEITEICGQSTTNNQGRQPEPFEPHIAESVRDLITDSYRSTSVAYEVLLDPNDLRPGVARELSRIVLPVGTYTEWYWTANLHNIMRFLKLRMDAHAQYEIMVYAEAMYDQLIELFPICMEAFDDYVGSSILLSRMEANLLRRLLPQLGTSLDSLEDQEGGRTALCEKYQLSQREYREFVAKFS